jgi:hypothetical protein
MARKEVGFRLYLLKNRVVSFVQVFRRGFWSISWRSVCILDVREFMTIKVRPALAGCASKLLVHLSASGVQVKKTTLDSIAMTTMLLFTCSAGYRTVMTDARAQPNPVAAKSLNLCISCNHFANKSDDSRGGEHDV